MKLKNILLVVRNIQRSVKFYQELFGLTVLTDLGGNVILTEGLVLQERDVWNRLIGREARQGDGYAELYFEENDMSAFLEKLERYPEPVPFLNPLTEHSWGQRVVRIYDPDRHVIEVGEAMNFVIRRLYEDGMPVEEISAKTGFPVSQIQGICG